MRYRVLWMVDVEADSPENAASKALEIQRDPESRALSFEVLIPPKYPETKAKFITVNFEEIKDTDVN